MIERLDRAGARAPVRRAGSTLARRAAGAVAFLLAALLVAGAAAAIAAATATSLDESRGIGPALWPSPTPQVP